MAFNCIQIGGTHRRKECVVKFVRRDLKWRAHLLIDGKEFPSVILGRSDKPCMETAKRLVDDALGVETARPIETTPDLQVFDGEGA